MRAAVVGTSWGQVHVDALRRHGVDVVAVCGSRPDSTRTRDVARELGVPVALHEPRRLLGMGLDLVTVATPAATHAPLLALFAGLPVICEKPVLGLRGDAAALPDPRPDLWVNYAFAFLDSARALTAALPRIGTPQHVHADSRHDLPWR